MNRTPQHETDGKKKDSTKQYNPAKSLSVYLSKNKYSPSPYDLVGHLQEPPQIEALSRAVIQAIRLASDSGDYKLILSLVENSIHFANQHPIIIPRVYGEAIDNLSKTPANVAKIKQLWNSGTSTESKYFLTEPLGTFELNVMIKAMASKGRVRAALDLYYNHTHTKQHVSRENSKVDTTEAIPIIPDPYTLSSIFTALQESISDDQITKHKNQTQTSTISGEDKHVEFPSSQCWQWNEAMKVLHSYQHQSMGESVQPLNNHVFACLLKLNDRVAQIYTHPAHSGSHMALYLLKTMHQLNISPDAVTCTLMISNLGYQWRTAINLLYAMKTASPVSSTESETEWRLPRPNVYTYSAVITICAHCHQYNAAMDLLEEMKNDETMDNPNTWVYNAALLATTRSDSLAVLAGESSAQKQQCEQHRSAPNQRRSRERLFVAMKLLREMQEDSSDTRCRPDTVTYNTVLAALGGIAGVALADDDESSSTDEKFTFVFKQLYSSSDKNQGMSFEERVVHSLLSEMENSKIRCDSITYRNALLAVRFSDDIRSSVWRILDRAAWVFGVGAKHGKNISSETSVRRLEGKAADGFTFVYDTAMTVLASRGDVEGVLLAFSKMLERSTTKSRLVFRDRVVAAQNHFIQALGRCAIETGQSVAKSSLIPLFLHAMNGDALAKLEVTKHCPAISNVLLIKHGENESIYSTAISSCLIANDIDNAREVLSMMKKAGLQPAEASLQEIARTYARMAVDALSKKDKSGTSEARQQRRRASKAVAHTATGTQDSAKTGSESTVYVPNGGRAKSWARNAYKIAMKTLSNAPASLLSTIARTCASVGMWEEASSILKRLHKMVLDEAKEFSSGGVSTQSVLPGLHQALLRATAIQGNVTAALWFVNDIQKLSDRLTSSARQQGSGDELLSITSVDKSLNDQGRTALLSSNLASIESCAMTAEDWKSLMVAAAKCGHWRVCMSTLQFLRHYLEETHPSSLGITVEERSRRYSHLAPALTVAVKCFEIRSQYGWAVRAIDDWIEWSGRRPPKAAILAATRILSSRGRGSEVNNLVVRCTQDNGELLSYTNDASNYEMALYVGAITALHHEGLYDDADDAFITAVNGKFLPFNLQGEEFEGSKRIVLDLHGMNVPVAHAAVRVALQQEEVASWNTRRKLRIPSMDSKTSMDPGESVWDTDMVIVTGRGRNSALRMRPVLRPEVQRMLVEEFYPPLSTTSIPGNTGALRIPSSDIKAWIAHQRRQKGTRMLTVASMLRDVSSIDRIRQSLVQKLQAEEGFGSSTGDSDEEDTT